MVSHHAARGNRLVVRGRHRIRRWARVLAEGTLRMLAARTVGLRVLNAAYRRLGKGPRAAVHSRFAGLYRGRAGRLADGIWTVDFAGKEVRLPMRAERAWLDWDVALSALGHEPTIKETYETILASSSPPELFVDIGANYGVHSLFFLVAGVETLTFEPNSTCHAFFREACAVNGVSPRLEHVALGDSAAAVDLYFPERQTWLGSINPEIIEQLKAQPGVRHERVEVRTLADYAGTFAGRRALIKIDAEEHEAPILAGAASILERDRPLVIFECHRPRRRAVLEQLSRHRYLLVQLPLRPGSRPVVLSASDFEQHQADDFLAIPAERLTDSV